MQGPLLLPGLCFLLSLFGAVTQKTKSECSEPEQRTCGPRAGPGATHGLQWAGEKCLF
uniref:Adhesion G protein-coupled receptor E3 n=1 Tax=Homo sapiens TaxID=9606 RepID=M0QYN7_HUMAN